MRKCRRAQIDTYNIKRLALRFVNSYGKAKPDRKLASEQLKRKIALSSRAIDLGYKVNIAIKVTSSNLSNNTLLQ